MAEAQDTIIFGSPVPWLGINLAAEDQRFFTSDEGSDCYSANLVNGNAGLAVDILLSGWEGSPTDDPSVTFYYGDLRLRSLGPQTTALTEAFARRLDISSAYESAHDVSTLIVECVALNGDPLQLKERGFVGKLFFGERGAEDECQLFLTIDPTNEIAWFGEKDAADGRKVLSWFGKLAS